MNRLALILVVAILFFSMLPVVVAVNYTNVSVSQAYTMIDSVLSLVVLDVRTRGEYNSGHIRNALHIPVSELEGRLDELNITDDILVHCKSGGRSASASQTLVNNGFLYIFNMLGGIDAWKSQGHPVYIKYSSIQEAINTASPGDTILVGSGTYYENIIVNKSVSLIGEDRKATIYSEYTLSAAEIKADYSVVREFTIVNLRSNSTYPQELCSILLNSSSNCEIIDNKLSPVLGDGIIIDGGSENKIIGNEIHEIPGNGISIRSSIDNLIMQNSVSTQGIGLNLSGCHFNNMYNNFFISTSSSECMKLWTSHNNTIERNTFHPDSGLETISLHNSSNNSIWHNQLNLTGHYGPAVNVDENSTNNVWDNGSEGNYWSNYNGTDLDNDGIGDTNLPWEGVDNYPLMNPYWNPGDIDHDLDVDIFDVVQAAVAYDSTPSDTNWNPHCDIAEPYGIIDIFDIVTISSSYGEEYNP